MLGRRLLHLSASKAIDRSLFKLTIVPEYPIAVLAMWLYASSPGQPMDSHL